MGSFQTARGLIETAVIDALADLETPVSVYTNNVALDPMDADSVWATLSLDWGETIRPTITGGTMEHLRGSVVLTIYGPKNQGPATLQDVIQEATLALTGLSETVRTSSTDPLVAVTNVNGPRFGILPDTPHAWVRSDFAIQAVVPTVQGD